MKTAVVNLDTIFSDVEKNRQKAEAYIKEAASEKAELIVFPEFFLTGFSLHPKLLSSIIQSEGTEEWLQTLSHTYQIIIGGSWLRYDKQKKNAYNTFGLFFPSGESYFHSKDIPTGLENFCYTAGDTNMVFDTPAGRIGLVMCWEQIRYDTVRRLAGKVDLIVAGSCWWGFTREDGEKIDKILREKNQNLARKAPLKLAEILGVPIVHASHAASFEGYSMINPKLPCTRPIESQAVTADASGTALVSSGEKPGLFFADITPGCTKKKVRIPKRRYWIPHMPFFLKKGFYLLNERYQPYYETNSRNKLEQLLAETELRKEGHTD